MHKRCLNFGGALKHLFKPGNIYQNSNFVLYNYLGIPKFKALFLRVKLLKEHCAITVISWHSLATEQHFVPKYKTKLVNNKMATASCKLHSNYKLFTLTESHLWQNTHNNSPDIHVCTPLPCQNMFLFRPNKPTDKKHFPHGNPWLIFRFNPYRTINFFVKAPLGELV